MSPAYDTPKSKPTPDSAVASPRVNAWSLIGARRSVSSMSSNRPYTTWAYPRTLCRRRIGNANDLLAPPLREPSQRSPARRGAAQCGLDRLRRREEG